MPDNKSDSDAQIRSRIDGITTHWSVVKNTSNFTLRYAPAIRNYIAAMATNPSDVEDILQDFLFRVVKSGFHRDRIDDGKFRYYLKATIRNAVRSHYRRKSTNLQEETVLTQLPSRQHETLDDQWTAQWRECLLDRTWSALERYQNDSPNRLAYTILKLSTDFPQETSAQLAIRATQLAGRPISGDSFRQQVHRSRKKFAELLIDEVVATLDQPSTADVEAELIDVELIGYVRDFLREI